MLCFVEYSAIASLDGVSFWTQILVLPSSCEFPDHKLCSKSWSGNFTMPRFTKTLDGILSSRDILKECFSPMAIPHRTSSVVDGIALNRVPQLPPITELPPAWLSEKYEKLDEFCQPHVTLSDTEKQVILEVGVQHYLAVSKKNTGGMPTVHISSDMLRRLGHDVTRMRVLQQSMFEDLTFLTLGETDIARAVNIFDDNRLICEFMKKHQLYEAVYPFRKFHHAHRDRVAKQISSVMAFHTMMGVFVVKDLLDQSHPDAGSLAEKIISGPKGLIQLALKGIS